MTEENAGRPSRNCETCDQESLHYIEWIGTDNAIHYSCWNCRQREEKRINLKSTWRRGGRAASRSNLN